MTVLHITRGLPGSGKSTYAKAWVAQDPQRRVRVNRDDLRDMLHGTRDSLTSAQERAVTEASHHAVEALLRTGRDVVVDDTHLRPRYIRDWRQIATRTGADLSTHEMPLDIDQAIQADASRDKPVGADVIRALAAKFTRNGHGYLPVLDNPAGASPAPYGHTPGLSWAIIVDIDGTVALMGDRSPYDWSKVSEDTINGPVAATTAALRAWAPTVLFVSGRDEQCRQQTWD